MKLTKLFSILPLLPLALTQYAEAKPSLERPCGWSYKATASQSGSGSPAQAGEGLEEGLTRQMNKKVEDWALNTLQSLHEMLAEADSKPMVEQRRILQACIQNALEDSSPLKADTLLRFSLNRVDAAVKTISLHAIDRSFEVQDEDHRYRSFAPGTVDQQVRILKAGIQLAIKYYIGDAKKAANGHWEKISIPNLTDIKFAQFGIDFHRLFTQVTYSIYDATAQYAILRQSLGWLVNDLGRDADAQIYGRLAMKLESQRQNLPDPQTLGDDARSDYLAVIYVRQIRDIIRQARDQLDTLQAELGKLNSKSTNSTN